MTPAAVGFLDHWQTLIGSAVGGVMGVAGALIVSSRATQRERRIAASAILPEIMMARAQFLGIAQSASRLAARYPDETRDGIAAIVRIETCHRAIAARLPLGVLRSPVVTQLSDVDERLYSHLILCLLKLDNFERRIPDFEFTEKIATTDGNPAVAGAFENLNILATKLEEDWNIYGEHIELANYFLDRLIYRRFPWFHRLRMRFRPNDLDLRSANLLKTGGIYRR